MFITKNITKPVFTSHVSMVINRTWHHLSAICFTILFVSPTPVLFSPDLLYCHISLFINES